MRHKCIKVAGALLAAAFVQMAHAETENSCIINPGTPATYASVAFNVVTPFDSVVASVAMCLPAAFNPFDSRYMTSDFNTLQRFRSDRPRSMYLSFK